MQNSPFFGVGHLPLIICDLDKLLDTFLYPHQAVNYDSSSYYSDYFGEHMILISLLNSKEKLFDSQFHCCMSILTINK